MKSKLSFAPLRPDAVAFLSNATEIDFYRADFTAPQWLCITARSPEGSVLGVFIAEFQVWFDAHITCAITDPRFLTRKLLHAIFYTLFSRASRITAYSRPENEASIRIIKHLGFQYEGYMRFAIEGKWDAMVFGMVQPECRWIRAPKPPIEFAKAA